MDRRHNNIPSKHKHVRVVTANKHADISTTNGIIYVESLNTINGSVATPPTGLAVRNENHCPTPAQWRFCICFGRAPAQWADPQQEVVPPD